MTRLLALHAGVALLTCACTRAPAEPNSDTDGHSGGTAASNGTGGVNTSGAGGAGGTALSDPTPRYHPPDWPSPPAFGNLTMTSSTLAQDNFERFCFRGTGRRMLLRLVRPFAALLLLGAGSSCDSKVSGASSPGGASGSAGSGAVADGSREEIYPISETGDDKAGAVAVDDEFVYWSQRGGGLVRAPKEGGGARLQLGRWDVIGVGQELVVSDQKAYWLDQSTLKTADADGTSSRKFDLPWYGSNLAVSGQVAYVTTSGCAAIGRVDLAAWTIEEQVPEAAPLGSAGRSYISAEGGDVYCASWRSVFRFEDFAPGVALTDRAERISGMTIADGKLYYLDRTSDTTHLQMLGSLSSPSDPVTLATENVLPQSPLLWDEPRNQLLFTSNGRLYAFSLETQDLRILAQIQSGGGLAIDQTHAYFSNSGPNLVSIERLRLD